MTNKLESQMLDALELFYYANKFRSHLFVIVLDDSSTLDELMLDIRMLNAAHIRTLILHHPCAQVTKTLDLWRQRGFPFHHYSNLQPQQVREGEHFPVGVEAIPICELNLDGYPNPHALVKAALQVAENVGADKVFFLGKEKGLVMGEKFVSHLHPQELQKYLDADNQFNIENEKLNLFMQASTRIGVEVVLLNSASGSLFEEIFTHRGSGSLFTSDYPNVIRQGRSGDLMDLLMLVKHEIADGSILPINEDFLADNVGHYFVFTVNDTIVAASTLVDYGVAAELAKFCTLPRYQGKGRAMQLALSMIETAAKQKKEYVFALSINKKMWTFFENLGFSEVDRKELPQQWQQQYDFSRPSRAFRLLL
ncbi:N-acetylglutamate synthase, GNAT family [Desulfuromusa kysingii]|uniref:N-acetylglutamate synthase, GNAT family n=1 Tax=Desulfuromusa kysingii TaxID=37625 RepID=A0A1H4AU39_9BACT|nr:GNAT family N-acetyltransferase [Desulfuromusa kysingii]SEA39308.1 N-acetylglutamate synthase, GNAT family [Desulfuromusa kysingii]